jgi:hypothetical protein
MVYLARTGQRAVALTQYNTCRTLLEQELGVEPDAETMALYGQILAGEIAQPVEAVATARHNLPVQTTPFVGRQAVLEEINRLLKDPACRLLTLVGPGGSGKTRLALEAGAAQLERYAHGVYFVSLAPLNSAESIVPTVADALGFTFYAGPEPQQQLLNYLRGKTMLLVMDNYEHLLPPPLSPPEGGTQGGGRAGDRDPPDGPKRQGPGHLAGAAERGGRVSLSGYGDGLPRSGEANTRVGRDIAIQRGQAVLAGSAPGAVGIRTHR